MSKFRYLLHRPIFRIFCICLALFYGYKVDRDLRDGVTFTGKDMVSKEVNEGRYLLHIYKKEAFIIILIVIALIPYKSNKSED